MIHSTDYLNSNKDDSNPNRTPSEDLVVLAIYHIANQQKYPRHEQHYSSSCKLLKAAIKMLKLYCHNKA